MDSLSIQAGLNPPGAARLLGGPMDGSFIPAVYLTQWLAISWKEGDAPEWYFRTMRDSRGIAVYTHSAVNDEELDWEAILGYTPGVSSWDDDDDDDGEDPIPVYTGP